MASFLCVHDTLVGKHHVTINYKNDMSPLWWAMCWHCSQKRNLNFYFLCLSVHCSPLCIDSNYLGLTVKSWLIKCFYSFKSKGFFYKCWLLSFVIMFCMIWLFRWSLACVIIETIICIISFNIMVVGLAKWSKYCNRSLI